MIKELFFLIIEILNQPLTKEIVKNFVGGVTFIFGCIQAYLIVRNWNKPASFQSIAPWTLTCTRLSIILSALVSRPALWGISIFMDFIFVNDDLSNFFGPNTLFVINPYHPRHLISIAALALSLPAIVYSLHQKIVRTYQKLSNYQQTSKPSRAKSLFFSDALCQVFVLFNMFTCRPILHIGNQIGRLIILSH